MTAADFRATHAQSHRRSVDPITFAKRTTPFRIERASFNATPTLGVANGEGSSLPRKVS